jgi:anti-sigma factor RsiW
MHEHRWTRAHLSEYLDDDLDPEGRRRVEEHVGICPKCRRMLESLRRMLRALIDLPADVPPGLADRVIGRLQNDA